MAENQQQKIGYKPVLHRSYGLLENFSTTFGSCLYPLRSLRLTLTWTSCALLRWRCSSYIQYWNFCGWQPCILVNLFPSPTRPVTSDFSKDKLYRHVCVHFHDRRRHCRNMLLPPIGRVHLSMGRRSRRAETRSSFRICCRLVEYHCLDYFLCK
jgi:hypothetical protein